MSLETTLARIAEIDRAFRPPAPPPAPNGGGGFASELASATNTLTATAPAGSFAGAGSGGVVAAAAGEVGQAEQPPGSNNSARITEYRSVNGGPVGPWCAYFVSWATAQAGVPIGDDGKGFASVDAAYAWAQRSGRAVPAGQGTPRPGDLIVWDEHIGIVESVAPDGRINTIEGNSSDAVSRRSYDAGGGGAIGYIRVG